MLAKAQDLPMWAQEFNGLYWHDMPGQMADDKKINFALYRRGLIQLEEAEAEVEAMDGGTMVATVLVGSDQVTYFGKRRKIRVKEGKSRFGRLNLGAGLLRRSERLNREREQSLHESKHVHRGKVAGVVTESQRELASRYKRLCETSPKWVKGRCRVAEACGVSAWSIDLWMRPEVAMSDELLTVANAAIERAWLDVAAHNELCGVVRGLLREFLSSWGRGAPGVLASRMGCNRARLIVIEREMERVDPEQVSRMHQELLAVLKIMKGEPV